MNIITTKNTVVQSSLALLLMFGWQQAQSCEETQNSSGGTVYIDCFNYDDQPKIKMPNLEVNSASIRIAPGSLTGIDVWFEIINSGQADTDWNLSNPGLYNNTGEFKMEYTVYVVSQDIHYNSHYDAHLSKWVPYSQTRSRENKLTAGATKLFTFGSTASPRFFLMDRNQTYKVGLSVIIDEPRPASIREASHGEVIESEEFPDNYYSLECLVYGYDIDDLSEILYVKHFHINGDLNLPMVGPC